MIKIKDKVKFLHSENRMNNEGNVSFSLINFDKNKNLYVLLKERFSWMNEFININDVGIEVGAAAGFSKKFIQCKDFKISDFSNHDQNSAYRSEVCRCTRANFTNQRTTTGNSGRRHLSWT